MSQSSSLKSSSKNKRSSSPTNSPLSNDQYKSPIGLEKRKRNEDIGDNKRRSDDLSSRKKKKRKSVVKREERKDKFCTHIPEELDDSQRLIMLNEEILKHTEEQYCKNGVVQEAFEKVKKEFMSNNLPKLIESSNTVVEKPNFTNQLNRIKEKMYSKAIAKLEKELEIWEKISTTLKDDKSMLETLASQASQLSTSTAQSESEEMKVIKNLPEILNQGIESSVTGVDHLNMFIETLIQLVRSSKDLQEQMFTQLREKSQKSGYGHPSTFISLFQEVKKTTEEERNTNLFEPKSIVGTKKYE